MILQDVTVMGHKIKGGTECYCVSRHVPSFAHTLPYTLPDGRTIFLCPNSFYATRTLLGMYKQLGGQPDQRTLARFSTTVQKLAYLHYRMESEGLTSQQILVPARAKLLLKEPD